MLYAFQGIVYFLRHPELWRKVMCPLVLTLMFGAATAYFMFFHTLPRQKDWLDDKDLPEELAGILAVCIVVTEMFVSTVVFGVVCIDYYEDIIFAFVLKERGLNSLLEGHEQRSTAVLVCTSYWLSRTVLAVVSLPLHLLPVLGSIVYAWLHGSVLAWEQHLFYFELKGFGLRQQQRWIRRYKLQYSSFGMQALLLEMVPCFGPFFMLTNACGSALLAEELERDGKRIGEEKTWFGSNNSSEYDTSECSGGKVEECDV
ncbi:hypothetical protein P3T76_010718 [Phytophthora citrophthora]|uniref:Uncharacterized protein n=1 Tax=Phytophthora citrophthora TaxID=4793 RepID=A0AAD9GBI9_9STRA|nr:hypothetical protein P3T76_010718 [Phytophthora citrophthora]